MNETPKESTPKESTPKESTPKESTPKDWSTDTTDFPAPEEVREQLRASSPDLEIDDLTLIGNGLDFVVYRAGASRAGPLALRMAKRRDLSTEIDPQTDARRLLRQEKLIIETMDAHGVPVPEVIRLDLDPEGRDVLIMRFVESDGSAPSLEEFGALMRAIHDAEPPEMKPVMETEESLGETLFRRVVQRCERVERGAGEKLYTLPEPERLREVAEFRSARPSLLHLDARSDNLLCRGGRIGAILDWSNALLADRTLDLCRIAEFGYVAPGYEIDPAFCAGYGDPHWRRRVPEAVETFYRLDTAVMLAVLFLFVLPDASRGREQVRRSRELASKLCDLIHSSN